MNYHIPVWGASAFGGVLGVVYHRIHSRNPLHFLKPVISY